MSYLAKALLRNTNCAMIFKSSKSQLSIGISNKMSQYHRLPTLFKRGHSEPSPRFRHYASSVGGSCLLWGGCVPGLSPKKLASTVEIFDPYLEMWEQQATSGDSPPGLVDGACAVLLDQLYSFGGTDGTSYYNSLHTLDPTSLKWKELPVLNQGAGPMRKERSGMFAYSQDRLAMFGGYGIPTGPIQRGAKFIENAKTRYKDGRGWTNELHIFTINEGM